MVKRIVNRRPRRRRFIRRKPMAKRRFGVKHRRRPIPRGVSTLANFPRVYKMRYCDYFTLNSTAGALGKYVFRANDIYDPNYTGTGHQPHFHDTLATMWNRYIVIGAKCSFSILGTNAPTAAIGGHAMGIIVDDNAITDSSYVDLVENGIGKHRLISPVQGQRACTVTGYFSAKKFFNIKDVKDNQAYIGSVFGGDPSQLAYFTCWYQSMIEDGTSSTGVQCRVVIDYIVHVSEPKELARS